MYIIYENTYYNYIKYFVIVINCEFPKVNIFISFES